MSGIDQSVFVYVDESIKQCKELASFIKKRQQADVEYAKALLKITAGFQRNSSGSAKSPITGALNMTLQAPQQSDLAKALLQKSSIWRIFNEIVADAENTASAQHVESVQDYTKGVEEVCNLLKKAKRELEQLQAQTADFSSSYSKAQASGTKERELEKISQKVNISVEKTLKAQENVKMYKDICNDAQSEYFGVLLPKLCEDILIKEEERSVAALRVMSDYLYVENLHQKTLLDSTGAMMGHASSVEISADSKDIVDKLIRKEVVHRHQMHANQHSDPICMDYLMVKRGTVVNEWTPQYCVFTSDKFLDFYDTNQLERPHSSLNLRESSVIELHPSLFNQKFSVQIIHYSNQTGNELISLSFATERDKDNWLYLLNLHTYCCPKCASVHGYNPSTECNQILAEKENGCRSIRSIEVGVIEAKDLIIDDFGQTGINPYCTIIFQDLKVAKTKAKSGEAPFWGEDFFFNEIRPHVQTLTIQIRHHNRLRRNMDIGSVEINLDTLKQGIKKTEEWYPIKRLKNDQEIQVGSIRLGLHYVVQQLLPRNEYNSFLSFLTEPHFKAINFLGGVTPSSMRASFAKTVVRLLLAKGVEHNRDGLLHSTLGKHMKIIYDSKESLESPDELRRNLKRLLDYVNGIWSAILESAGNCPQSFGAIFASIYLSIPSKWNDNPNWFLFLRFFCPAILSPHLFKLVDDIPDVNRARTFTLLAKIIQSLANLTEFGQKEQYLAGFNTFITEQIPVMKNFIDKISTQCPIAPTSPRRVSPISANFPETPTSSPVVSEIASRINLRRETEEFYQLCKQLIKDIQGQRDRLKSTSPDVYICERLLSEFKKLNNCHEVWTNTPLIRGRESSNSSARQGRRASASLVTPSNSLNPAAGGSRKTSVQTVSQAVRFGSDFEDTTSIKSGRNSVGAEITPSSQPNAPLLTLENSPSIPDGIGANDSPSAPTRLLQPANKKLMEVDEMNGSMNAVSGSHQSIAESVNDESGERGRRPSLLWNTLKKIGDSALTGSRDSMDRSSKEAATKENPVKSFLGLFGGSKRPSLNTAAVQAADDPEESLAYIYSKGFDKMKTVGSEVWDEAQSSKSGKSTDSVSFLDHEPGTGVVSPVMVKLLESNSDIQVPEHAVVSHSPHPMRLQRQNSAGHKPHLGKMAAKFSNDLLVQKVGSQTDIRGHSPPPPLPSPKKSFSTHQ
ncbi:hypothetical protein BCR33DRAFT_719172 [Rhizoclosmatium globosum]|uniref:Rho GTPase activation protein n=1 Tax=Rhizoclosmatium globosum TaxID=329046 RepID=A0A1Y2C2I1_9FUNG|nr:hypothetical protein BCR33DRAFT_719172 [Rhizoclosmatium globosum]|eukprot:ORY41094.1 hypothetical protein BCR33DRAFT_719172 [Rhizoclosmatium globosum]